MEIGLGVLRLAPEAFWAMTVAELTAALDGWTESHGGQKTADKTEMYDELLDLAASVPEVTGNIGEASET